MQQLVALALHHAADGDAGPPADNLCNVVGRDLFAHHGVVALGVVQLLLYCGDVVFERFQASVAYLGHTFVVAFAFGPFGLQLEILHLLLVFLNLVHQCAFAFPLGPELLFLVFEFGDVLVELCNLLLVVLPFDGFALNLQLFQPSCYFVKLFRYGVSLHAELCCCLVHQVDGLVRQEPVGDVTLRQFHGGNARVVLYTHLVVVLVALFQPSQYAYGAQLVGLVNHHGLEASFQCLVLLKVLLVLIERGGTNASEFASGQSGFQDVGCIHGTFAPSGSDKGVNLVYEEYYAALTLGYFVDDAFQTLFKLAFILGSGDQCAHVERVYLLVLEVLGNVAPDYSLGQALNDCRLSCARFAYQYRVVLGAARQYLQYAANLVVSSNHRVELALACLLYEVFGVFLKALVVFVGRLRLYALSLPQFVDGRPHLFFGAPGVFEYAACRGVYREQCQQQRLYAHELVAHLAGIVDGLLQNAVRLVA